MSDASPATEAVVQPVAAPSEVAKSPDFTGALKKIITSLYFSPFCPEFRRPVRVLHPSIAQVYRQAVSQPRDLGTILLHILTGAYSDVTKLPECSRDIALVFENSISFNSGALEMTNISSHLLRYAQSLWEECLSGPFGDCSLEPRLFLEKRLEDRAARFAYVRTAPLYEEDKQDFLAVLEGGLPAAPPALVGAVGMSVALCRQRLQSGEDITLSELLFPIIEQLVSVSHSGAGGVVRRLPRGIEIELAVYLEATKDARYSLDSVLKGVDKDTLYLLVDIDNRIGELLCHLCERKTRGYALSAVWAHPHRFVWAQPNKSPWWPGMLLAGGDTPQYLADINLRRLPASIRKELEKLRPRTGNGHPLSRASTPVPEGAPMDIDSAQDADGSEEAVAPSAPAASESTEENEYFAIPPNYCLVEFFGNTHDFGWVKTENVAPFPLDGAFNIQREGRNERCTNNRAITEAVDAREALVAAMSAPRDGAATLPSLEQLSADAAVPDVAAEEPKAARKRAHRKSAGGDSGPDGQEPKPKKPSKKQPAAEGKRRDEPGMRFKSLAKRPPYEFEVSSQAKQRSLTDIHMLAMYLRSVEPVGQSSSKHSVPPPPANGVPPPPYVSLGIKSAAGEAERGEPFQTPRVFRYVDPNSVPKKSRKTAAMLAMDAANITEPLPELADKKMKKGAAAVTKKVVKAAPEEEQSIDTPAGKKRRSRAKQPATAAPTSKPGQKLSSSAKPSSAPPKPVTLRSGKRIQWRQVQLLKFAKMRANDEMDIPNLVAPTPDANGVNQLSESAMHRNWMTTLSTLSHQMGLSCSRVYYGEGVVHSEDVDLNSEVFNLEDKSCEKRKEILRGEIERLRKEIERLDHSSVNPAV